MHPRCHFPNYEYRSNPRNPRLNNNRKPPVEYYATSWTNIEVKLFYSGNFNVVVYPEAIRELTAHFHPTPIGRAAADADTDRVVPVRSIAVGPTGGHSYRSHRWG